jgi:phosphoribosylformimino-5-aminoimidazole carboxamide ribotide isomerase
MRLFPAIDVLDGNVVRLVQGDYGKVKRFQPLDDVVKWFLESEVQAVHMVDLTAAKDSRNLANRTLLLETVRSHLAGRVFVELGGGIRTADDAESVLANGVDRVIIGTMALKDPATISCLAARYPDRIAVALDFKTEGSRQLIAVKGWQEMTDLELDDAIRTQLELGVATFLITDVTRDGMGTGPNLDTYRRLIDSYPVSVIASGGVARLADLGKLKSLETGALGRIEGVVVGTALYEGGIDLKEGLALCSR